MTTDLATGETATDLPQRRHPACIACGARSGDGLGLRFVEEADGAVIGSFACDDKYQGYPDRLHGGVIAMLLDAAMVHCLFTRGFCGTTARLDIKFRHPVALKVDATVRARVVRKSPPLYVLKAEVLQYGTVRAVAQGLFSTRNLPPSPKTSVT